MGTVRHLASSHRGGEASRHQRISLYYTRTARDKHIHSLQASTDGCSAGVVHDS